MAKRYALVPESWLSSLNGTGQAEPSAMSVPNFQNVSSGNSVPTTSSSFSTSIFGEPKQQKQMSGTLTALAELIPKNLRGRARMVLHYLENSNVNINDVQRVIYDDGNVGSHIIDLVRYTISPFVKSRPVDWPQFRGLLEKVGVPDSVFAKRTTSELKDSSPLSRWKPY